MLPKNFDATELHADAKLQNRKKVLAFFFFFSCLFKSALYPFVDKGRRKRPWINGDSSDVSVAHFLSPSV